MTCAIKMLKDDIGSKTERPNLKDLQGFKSLFSYLFFPFINITKLQ